MVFLLCVIGSEGGPSPIKLVAYTVTLILVDKGQWEELVSNVWVQIPAMQDEAPMMAEPHLLLDSESE